MELLEPVVTDLTAAFEKFDYKARSAKDKCLSDLERLLDRIRKDLGGEHTHIVSDHSLC